MDKQKLIKQLFVGKVSDIIGIEKTTELLKEATDAINAIPEGQTLPLDSVTQQRELFDKFYAWLDGLTQEEYDDMSLTDKCEKYFFKI